MKARYFLFAALTLTSCTGDIDLRTVYVVRELTAPNEKKNLFIIRESRGLSYLKYYLSATPEYCNIDASKCAVRTSDIVDFYYRYAQDTFFIYGSRFDSLKKVGGFEIKNIPFPPVNEAQTDSLINTLKLNHISFLDDSQQVYCEP